MLDSNKVLFRLTRRRFLGYGLATLAGAATIDGFFVEPAHPVIERREIQLARLPKSFSGFRIALISDIHFGPFMGRAGVGRAVRLAQTFSPDLLVLVGDFVSHPFGQSNGAAGAHHAEPCADVLATWKGVPMAAVLGNHDWWNGAEIVTGALAERGITVLRNQSIAIERGGDRLWIAGVDDVYEGHADLPRALSSVPNSEATLLLAHEPDFADYAARFPIDLQLSGHSHGGQVRVPGIGPIVLPELGRKYNNGWYRSGNLQIYTNRGLGVIDPPVRFNCPPEVTHITLKSSLART
ncbi:MAG TPA: metallophosphoesterase [Verrucomicrobiae bacterium]|nr:metallophosphoesterase [Verrucomicrobiae bacterium]